MGITSPEINMDAFDKTLNGMSSTQFVEYLGSHAKTFDMMEEHTKLIVNALEGLMTGPA